MKTICVRDECRKKLTIEEIREMQEEITRVNRVNDAKQELNESRDMFVSVVDLISLKECLDYQKELDERYERDYDIMTKHYYYKKR